MRGHPGAEQHLIGVDVSEAGQQPLIEQQGLDGRLTPGEPRSQLAAGRQVGESVGTEACQGGFVELLRRENRHESKSTRVDEANLLVGGANHHVGVGCLGLTGIGYLHPPRHSEMNHPGEVALDIDEDELPPPPEPEHTPAAQPIGEVSIPWLAPQHAGPTRLGIDNSMASQMRLELAAGGFDFWQLRHPDQATVPGMIAFFTALRTFAVAMRRGLGDPQFRALAFLVLVLLISGTLFYWRFEDWTLLDSLYFSVITLTTVGYGDLAPTRAPTKVFTIVYILLGLGILVSFLSLVAGHAVEARVERRQQRKPKE